MSDQVTEKVGLFLNDALTGKVSVEKFEQQVNELSFDGPNANVWQFIVLKSFDTDFSYLQPLANHLLDHNYCLVEGPMVKYAALNGYKIEASLARMQEPLDELNRFTQECGFSEKAVVVNKPAEAILGIAKKIINQSNDKDFQEVKEILENAGVDVSKVKLMQKPVKTSLKV